MAYAVGEKLAWAKSELVKSLVITSIQGQEHLCPEWKLNISVIFWNTACRKSVCAKDPWMKLYDGGNIQQQIVAEGVIFTL